MNMNKALDQATKQAEKAIGEGSVSIDGITYTLKFKPLEWVYQVQDNEGNFIVNFNTKKITQAKSWLRDYLKN
jgi:hypothetical protein